MLKNILNLEGAQKLTKNEQKSINGRYAPNPNTGYVSTLTGEQSDQCRSTDDCPMKTNYDGSLMTPKCVMTAYGTRCMYDNY
jgi:hypothetical protein